MAMSRRRFSFTSKHKKHKAAARSVATAVPPQHPTSATITEGDERQDPEAVVRLRSELSQAVIKRQNEILREKVQALTEENERLRKMLGSMTKQNGAVLVDLLTEENKRLRKMLGSMTKQNGAVLVDLRSTLQSAIATIDKKIYSDQDSMATSAHKKRSAAASDPTPNLPVLRHTLSIQRSSRKDIVSITSTTSHDSNGSQTSAVISCRSSAAYNGSSESEDTPGSAARQVRANVPAATGPLLAGEVNPLEEEGREEGEGEVEREEEKEEEEEVKREDEEGEGEGEREEEDHVQSTVTLVPPKPVNPAATTMTAEGTSCISSVLPKRPLEFDRATMKKKSSKTIPSLYESTESEGDHSTGKKPVKHQHLHFKPHEDKGAVSSEKEEAQDRSGRAEQPNASHETELEKTFRERKEKRKLMHTTSS